MTTTKHLWAIGFDDMTRADQVRDKIVRIERNRNEFILNDVAVVVRHPDGSLTIDRQPVARRTISCNAPRWASSRASCLRAAHGRDCRRLDGWG